MNEARYDLHCHTVYSDGTASVDELMDLALQKGLQGLSITDHDTIGAYQEAFEAAKQRNLLLLPGVEISTVFKGESVHLLAYSFSLKDEKFQKLMNQLQKIRKERNLEILRRLEAHGMPLDQKKLKEDIGVIGRPHMANALLALGHVQSTREAFDRFIGEGMPCFAPGARLDIEKVIKRLHEANAFAIVAHPHLLKNPALEEELFQLPLDGLEVHYANFNIEEEKKWKKIADERNWIKTGGSDYHGLNKKHIELSASYTREETFLKLWQRYQDNEQLSQNRSTAL